MPLQILLFNQLGSVWLQYKDRIDVNLIKPAVDWRKAGSRNAMMSAAIAK